MPCEGQIDLLADTQWSSKIGKERKYVAEVTLKRCVVAAVVVKENHVKFPHAATIGEILIDLLFSPYKNHTKTGNLKSSILFVQYVNLYNKFH